MDAYLVPVLTALAGAFATAAVLGAVRVGRWWAAAGGRRAEAVAGAPPGVGEAPGPAIPADASDPHLSRLAHRTLGAALLLGLIGIFLFAPDPDPQAARLAPPAALALVAAWAVGRSPR